MSGYAGTRQLHVHVHVSNILIPARVTFHTEGGGAHWDSPPEFKKL